MVSSLKLEKLEKKNSDLYCRHEKKERKKEKKYSSIQGVPACGAFAYCHFLFTLVFCKFWCLIIWTFNFDI